METYTHRHLGLKTMRARARLCVDVCGCVSVWVCVMGGDLTLGIEWTKNHITSLS